MRAQASTTNEIAFGRIGSDDALAAIRAENRRAGVNMSSSDEIATAHQLANALRLDPRTGKTFVVDVDGNETVGLSAADFIIKLHAVATLASRDKASGTPASKGLNPTQRAVEKNKALRAAKAESKAAEAVELVKRHGNSFQTGNVTHRHFVQNVNPTLADQLRNSAGK